MNSLQPCTDYLPSTIAGSPRKRYSTSCNSITPILRSGFRTRPCSYQGERRLWSAFTSANNEQSTTAGELHRPPRDYVNADRGVSADLEFARALNESTAPPKRSIIAWRRWSGPRPQGIRNLRCSARDRQGARRGAPRAPKLNRGLAR